MKKGFTLAEVLITLGVIGVVAAMTLPVLVQKYTDYKNIVAWRKSYSVIQNAFNSTIAEGVPVCSVFNKSGCVEPRHGFSASDEFIATMRKHLKVIDVCAYQGNTLLYPTCKKKGVETHSWSGIWGTSNYSVYGTLKGKARSGVSRLNSYDFMNFAFLLSDGSVIYFGGMHSGLTIAVDVNSAAKGPNQLGRDLFSLRVIIEDSGKKVYLRPNGSKGTVGYSDSNNGNSGCSPNIGVAQANYIYTAAGSGCSQKYLIEK